MAGSYPNAPSGKIAYDEDGTIVWEASGNGNAEFTGMFLPPNELPSSSLVELNDEDTVIVRAAGGPGESDYGYAWIWPEKRDIYGFFGYALGTNYNAMGEISVSTESRNGITGSWSTLAAYDSVDTSGNPIDELVQPSGRTTWSVQHSYREFIHPLNSTGTTSVRARTQIFKSVGGAANPAHICAFHWYGEIADGANPDRVLFIDNDSGLELLLQDWGDIPRGSVHDKEAYLLNNSPTLSASSNVITFEGLYEDSYTWYTITETNSTIPFSSTLTVDGPLSPGARYPSTDTLTIRLSVPLSEDLGPNSARLQLVSQWST